MSSSPPLLMVQKKLAAVDAEKAELKTKAAAAEEAEHNSADEWKREVDSRSA